MPTRAAPTDVASRIADALDGAGLPYALGGALALGAWGVPRATVDVDVCVFVPETRLSEVLGALAEAGAEADRAAAANAVARMGMFITRADGRRVDVFVAHHPMHEDMERRRVLLPAPDGKRRHFLSAEDVLLTNFIYGRPKDVIDLERLAAVQAGRLDFAYARRWLSRIVTVGDHRLALLADLERRHARG